MIYGRSKFEQVSPFSGAREAAPKNSNTNLASRSKSIRLEKEGRDLRAGEEEYFSFSIFRKTVFLMALKRVEIFNLTLVAQKASSKQGKIYTTRSHEKKKAIQKKEKVLQQKILFLPALKSAAS